GPRSTIGTLETRNSDLSLVNPRIAIKDTGGPSASMVIVPTNGPFRLKGASVTNLATRASGKSWVVPVLTTVPDVSTNEKLMVVGFVVGLGIAPPGFTAPPTST